MTEPPFDLVAAGPTLGYDLRYDGECCDLEVTIILHGAAAPDPEGAPLPSRCVGCGLELRLARTSPAGWQAPDLDDEALADAEDLTPDEAGEYLLKLGEALTAGGTPRRPPMSDDAGRVGVTSEPRPDGTTATPTGSSRPSPDSPAGRPTADGASSRARACARAPCPHDRCHPPHP